LTAPSTCGTAANRPTTCTPTSSFAPALAACTRRKTEFALPLLLNIALAIIFMEVPMRKFVAVIFLLLCTTSLIYGQKTRYGQTPDKPNPADYPINVHISATHLRNICNEPGANVICSIELYADAVLDGKKFELSGSSVIIQKQSVLIIPGNYSARLTKDIHNADSTAIRQDYEILLPDGTVWKCFTSGISD
jgi:hypothetical protein